MYRSILSRANRECLASLDKFLQLVFFLVKMAGDSFSILVIHGVIRAYRFSSTVWLIKGYCSAPGAAPCFLLRQRSSDGVQVKGRLVPLLQSAYYKRV